MVSCGARHAARPAMATEAPMSFMKLRRSTPLSRAMACCGNSWCMKSSKTSLRASSSRLRQYSLPRRSPTRARNSVKFSVLFSLMEWLLRASVMTRRTMGHALDPVTLHELGSQRFLVLGHVGHVEDFLARPDLLLGIAMALDAPLHRQRRGLVDEVHLVDAAVAGRASDALGDVDAVVEMDKVRQAVHAHPLQRAVGLVALTHRREDVRAGPDLRVAVHAG